MKTIFRIDDIGASTKHFNQHGNTVLRCMGFPFFYFPLANFWFFKTLWPFAGWAKYDELTVKEWELFLKSFKLNKIKPIVAVTATWVDEKSQLIPFPEKFPKEASFLKKAFHDGDIVIANHGLTHCVVGKHLPKLFGSNRQYQREFWPYLPAKLHRDHILKSQEILETYFQKPINILVPPGNVWSLKTYKAMVGTNLKKVICNKYMLDSNEKMKQIKFIKDDNGFFNFHDRELKLYGINWLNKQIENYINL